MGICWSSSAENDGILEALADNDRVESVSRVTLPRSHTLVPIDDAGTMADADDDDWGLAIVRLHSDVRSQSKAVDLSRR